MTSDGVQLNSPDIVWKLYRTKQPNKLAKHSPEKPNGKPVHCLSDWYEADSKAESAESSKIGDKVKPGHLLRPLKFWMKISKN